MKTTSSDVQVEPVVRNLCYVRRKLKYMSENTLSMQLYILTFWLVADLTANLTYFEQNINILVA